ncbi:MAG: Nucleoside-diphosphate-sugar epimerase [Candidatus Beckwithbacteria bacterium GW2011_GWB1_47_15]|uniref:Nucleoside-diphosphate-sugar epimerase n=1 Tax=Candidatus Beckwithbacteria bacterium GW2011_GWB1_47_15 TaxID=1618371 RepID=A0A0G1RX78_9BACT|nr:MAG: UDP-glucose 4-epimerase [Candidatus Beckwithbacteria bacterium GW2011_GWC1_49_16]KKU35657.1 MAG: Nucleoside-diphosphate-sugar epimerase [Candidatus Beckwithbacteria bacterium GW2011_GWA1_46_30]KKU61711.1 MAG: Nucleoside-diphosphate-sugar epimerase [Candidatus Beckwithbacteria bacterium GW2011_GWB1_47_15]KKU72215.1 MAG: Nucleoside-diphosphate-sugar epimerase [Candidatus Beckwithbacteria bacterium GW2011_GWA2_47_25]KKW05024.1 MAG: Nucleoside-diphosphate-sugar epimerase [Candidatus Beckwit
MKTKKVLVTGGAGFIGSHTVDELKRLGIAVTIFESDQDVKNEIVVKKAVKGHGGVIHLAATLGTQETVTNPKPVVKNNILGSLNIFEAIRETNIPAVYISVGNHWMNNPYSITKSTAERFALMFNKEFGTKIAVVRGLNAYGPKQKDKPVRKMIPNFIIPALKNEPITIYGDGQQIMDLIYVKDLAKILVRALIKNHGVYDRVFEAGMGQKITVNQIVKLVIKLTKSKSKISYAPMRPGEIPNSIVMANKKVWNLEKLGWHSTDFTPLIKGLKQTIRYYEGLFH